MIGVTRLRDISQGIVKEPDLGLRGYIVLLVVKDWGIDVHSLVFWRTLNNFGNGEKVTCLCISVNTKI